MRTSSPHRHAAFTLIEMLSAIAVFSMLMVGIFAVYNQLAKAWTLGEKRTEAFQNVRLVLEMMGRELEGAIARSNATTGTKITFHSYANEASLPGSPANLSGGGPNDQLFFISTASDTAGTTDIDLTEYGYFVGFATADTFAYRAGHYYLIRHKVVSSGSGYDFLTNPGSWDDTPAFGNNTKTPILENVLRLEFRFQALDATPGTTGATNGTQIVEEWSTDSCPDSCPCATVPDLHLSDGITPRYPDPTIQLPRAVHIRIVLMDRRNADRMAAVLNNSPIPDAQLGQVIPNCSGEDLDTLATTAPVLAGIIREGTHTFYKTVYLRNSE